jgi:UDPglucose--hexose-1-phosphate uridylyltransferase
MAIDLMQPHRRLNLLNGQWVQVSPQRMERPWQGEETEPDPPAPSYDAGCYLCPGNVRKGGEANPDYAGVYVFDNDFPALSDDPEIPREQVSLAGPKDSLFIATESRGACRVICFTPDHSRTMPELSLAEIGAIIDIWAAQTAQLGERYSSVQVFENKGAMMGCSNPHPHGQVWASDIVPKALTDEDWYQQQYFKAHGQRLLLNLAEREIELGERVVEMTAHWLAVVPYWAEWPFEVLLLPRFAVERLPQLDTAQRSDLAVILRAITTRYDNLFQTSFPYSMGWHGAPFLKAPAGHWQLHAHFYPPLLRSASVRKFMVGYEMLAEPQRDLTPERAADMLRSVSAVDHYRASR